MKRLLRRLAQSLIALGIVVGLGVAPAGVASAYGIGEQACRYEVGRYNTCLLVWNLGAGWYQVRIGIDITMSQQEAQAHIDRHVYGGERLLFSGIWGDDGPNKIQVIPVSMYRTSLSAWSGGLSAEWEATVWHSQLDEDSGVDELFGEVLFYYEDTRLTRYRTGQVVGAF